MDGVMTDELRRLSDPEIEAMLRRLIDHDTPADEVVALMRAADLMVAVRGFIGAQKEAEDVVGLADSLQVSMNRVDGGRGVGIKAVCNSFKKHDNTEGVRPGHELVFRIRNRQVQAVVRPER